MGVNISGHTRWRLPYASRGFCVFDVPWVRLHAVGLAVGQGNRYRRNASPNKDRFGMSRTASQRE